MQLNTTRFLVPLYLYFILEGSPPKTNKQDLFPSPSFPPVQHLFICFIGIVITTCHIVHPFVQSALLANVQCSESFKVCSRPLIFGTPSSVDPHQNSSQISHNQSIYGHPVGVIPQDQSLHVLEQFIVGQMLGWPTKGTEFLPGQQLNCTVQGTGASCKG